MAKVSLGCNAPLEETSGGRARGASEPPQRPAPPPHASPGLGLGERPPTGRGPENAAAAWPPGAAFPWPWQRVGRPREAAAAQAQRPAPPRPPRSGAPVRAALAGPAGSMGLRMESGGRRSRGAGGSVVAPLLSGWKGAGGGGAGAAWAGCAGVRPLPALPAGSAERGPSPRLPPGAGGGRCPRLPRCHGGGCPGHAAGAGVSGLALFTAGCPSLCRPVCHAWGAGPVLWGTPAAVKTATCRLSERGLAAGPVERYM